MALLTFIMAIANIYNGKQEKLFPLYHYKSLQFHVSLKKLSGHSATGPNFFALHAIPSIFASNGVKQMNEMTILPSSQLEF